MCVCVRACVLHVSTNEIQLGWTLLGDVVKPLTVTAILHVIHYTTVLQGQREEVCMYIVHVYTLAGKEVLLIHNSVNMYMCVNTKTVRETEIQILGQVFFKEKMTALR